MLTKKQAAELRKLDRLVLSGRATRAQILRAIDLKNAARKGAHPPKVKA